MRKILFGVLIGATTMGLVAGISQLQVKKEMILDLITIVNVQGCDYLTIVGGREFGITHSGSCQNVIHLEKR